MCSRLSIYSPNLEESLASHHNIHPDKWRGKSQYEPKYSVRYEKSAPVLMMDTKNPKEPSLVLEQMRWGMQRKDFNDRTNIIDIFTAKATTLVDASKVWSRVRLRGRCIVPCNG
jgi:putative SOS response-associated peptidase YedK